MMRINTAIFIWIMRRMRFWATIFCHSRTLIRIKRVEDVLEKYWNAHRMDHTVKYLVERAFSSPFDFFQQFGDFWEGRGWQKIGHQLEDLFSRLWAFLSEAHALRAKQEGLDWQPDVALGLMKLDYFLGHKFKPRKLWWDFTMDKSVWSSWMQRLAQRPEEVSEAFQNLGLAERELQKHAVIELLPFDLNLYLKEGIVSKDKETLLIVIYNGGGKEDVTSAKPFMLTLVKTEHS